MSNLVWKKLSEVVELVMDNRGRNPKSYTTEGIPIIDNYLITSSGEVNLGEVNRYIDEETYNSFLRKYIVEGDVLMTLVGNGYGKVAITPKERCAIIQNTIGLRCNKDNSNQFLYYLLRNNRESLMNLNRGAAQPSIKVGDVLNLEFGFPPIDNQNRIANILETMDKKIQLNRQTNQTLEQIAQAIFKSWFVDFEPVKAKIAAKQAGATAEQIERAAMCAIASGDVHGCTNVAGAGSAGATKTLDQLQQLSPDTLQQLKTTAALFPDALVDSELGEMPEGWEVGSIGDIAIAKGGYAFKGKSFTDAGNPVVKIKNITGDGRVELVGCQCIDDEQAKSAKRFKLSNGDLLMAMTGATVAKIGIVVTEGKAAYLNQRVAKFESEKFGSKISWFLYCCFQRDSIFDSVVGAAQGSAQPNISSSGIESTELILPNDKLIELFCNRVDSLFMQWISNINENSTLTDARDTLLPKLLSGELSLAELDSQAAS